MKVESPYLSNYTICDINSTNLDKINMSSIVDKNITTP